MTPTTPQMDGKMEEILQELDMCAAKKYRTPLQGAELGALFDHALAQKAMSDAAAAIRPLQSQLQEANKWNNDIEAAPKDAWILVWCPHWEQCVTVIWDHNENGWVQRNGTEVSTDFGAPSHWMPCPSRPRNSEKE